MDLAEPPALFIELVDYCRLLPGAVAGRFLGEPLFRVRGHVFAFLARRDRVSVTVRTRRANVKELVQQPQIRRARGISWWGWITVDVRDRSTLPLARALIGESYRLAADRSARRRDAH